jgi:uncharacterized LabA/DUF88 family protein
MNSNNLRDLRDKTNTPKNNYAFIDAHNLYRSSLHWGWKLDYAKFLNFLQIKYNITTAYLFMGYRSENNEAYINLQKHGFILVFKDTTEKEEEIKGNSDVELVLQTLVEINQYSKAVIVTGDGDFGALVRYLNSVDKLEALLVPSDTFVPSILRRTAREKITYLNNLKSELASHNFHYNVPNNLPNIGDPRKITNNNSTRRLGYNNNNLNNLNTVNTINSLNKPNPIERKSLDTEIKNNPETLDKKAQLLEAVKQAKLKSQEIIGTQKAVINLKPILTSKPEINKPEIINNPVTEVVEDANKKIQNIVDNLMSAATLVDDSVDKTEKKVYKPRLKKKQQNSEIETDAKEKLDPTQSKPSIHLE